MKILVTGACGFVGRNLIRCLQQDMEGTQFAAFDNLMRPGSEVNRAELIKAGVRVFHGDLRNASDLDVLPSADWVIDAAANPSVLAGVDGKTSSRQLIEHNLFGTVNLLEYCKRHSAGFVLLSTSRVYAIEPLAKVAVEVIDDAFVPRVNQAFPMGLGPAGVQEGYSTDPPLSLYGASKLSSETIALEYGATFNLPVWVNRCGVLAGAGQFGRADQGIFAFWLNAYLRRRPLRYIGFDGQGHQVRDCLHPRDLAVLIVQQLRAPEQRVARVQNVSGGIQNSVSLAQLSAWCARRFGSHSIGSEPQPRAFDIPWMVLDSSRAREQWGWTPQIGLDEILTEIAEHAEKNPSWLEVSGN
jgi:CDP-paratose 2-epimerase